MCSVWLLRDPYLRLHVHYTHLILGLYRADSLYTCAVLVLLVFPVLYEPGGKPQNLNFSRMQIIEVYTKALQHQCEHTCCLKHRHQIAVW